MLNLCKRNHEQINLQYINYIYINWYIAQIS